ncbi:hypothetical protein GCM10027610_094450 [Dactylosporangium cerinum]
MRLRGMTPEEAGARIAAQATDEQRRAVADVAIVNDGTPEDLDAAVEAAWPAIAGLSHPEPRPGPGTQGRSRRPVARVARSHHGALAGRDGPGQQPGAGRADRVVVGLLSGRPPRAAYGSTVAR